jgi:hypothetical protein
MLQMMYDLYFTEQFSRGIAELPTFKIYTADLPDQTPLYHT